MSRPKCGDYELVIRGITSAYVDDGDVDPEFFEGRAVSVNRAVITPLEESLEIFRRKLTNPEKGVKLAGYATVICDNLYCVTARYVENNKDLKKANFSVVVEEAREDDNPGHAEVMPKINQNLAIYLVNEEAFTEICVL